MHFPKSNRLEENGTALGGSNERDENESRREVQASESATTYDVV